MSLFCTLSLSWKISQQTLAINECVWGNGKKNVEKKKTVFLEQVGIYKMKRISNLRH